MNEKIVVTDPSKAGEGSWVYETQGVAADKDFSHVSSAWYPQTISYQDGLERLEKDVQEREDLMLKASSISVKADDGDIVFHIGDRDFRPTPHALRQFGTWAYVPHTLINSMLEPVLKPNGETRFDRDQLDYDTFQRVLNNGLRRVEPDKVFRFRTYKDGTLRAMLSDLYAPIDNRWYIQVLEENLPGGRLSHFDRSTADTIYGNVLIPDSIREEADGDYGGMVSISNCEIGTRRLGQMPSLFRAICMNGCIWGETKGKKFSFVHKAKDTSAKLGTLRPQLSANIREQIPILQSAINQFLETRNFDTQGVNIVYCLAKVASEYKLTPAEINVVAEQWNQYEKDFRSLFGIVNAITRTGQTLSPDRWVKFDEIGGELASMSRERWSGFVKQASTLDVKDIDKAFGRKDD